MFNNNARDLAPKARASLREELGQDPGPHLTPREAQPAAQAALDGAGDPPRRASASKTAIALRSASTSPPPPPRPARAAAMSAAVRSAFRAVPRTTTSTAAPSGVLARKSAEALPSAALALRPGGSTREPGLGQAFAQRALVDEVLRRPSRRTRRHGARVPPRRRAL